MKSTITSIAPGRTCLFGDHQDYLGLPIIACAINRHIRITAAPNESMLFVINAPDTGEQRTIPIDDEITAVAKDDHMLAALKRLKRYGCIPDKGYDITIKGDLPINAGLSSSSALVVAWVNFLLTAYGADEPITEEFVARVAYEAEVLEHDSPGGKMDQYTIGLGNVLYLETGDDFSYEVIPTSIPGLIIGESGIPKETVGVLGHLKKNALLAISHVQEADPDFNLKTAKAADLPKYLAHVPHHLQDYFFAAIENHRITQEALVAIKEPSTDFKVIGRLINEHHAMLKDKLNITVPRIDDMIDAALAAGAYGAKIVGSGKGGSIAVIAPLGQQSAIIAALLAAGAKAAYEVEVDSGPQILIET